MIPSDGATITRCVSPQLTVCGSRRSKLKDEATLPIDDRSRLVTSVHPFTVTPSDRAP